MATAIEPQLQEQKNLASLFEPRSIAVVGASRRPEAVGHAVLKNLITAGFTGPVYPVNPKATEIEGLACYPSLSLIPHSIDLAILIVPSHETLDAIKACGEKKVKSVIIISAGFREVGPEGQALERQVKETARALGISFLGPNCLGLINTDPLYRMNASFGRTMPKSGNIAFISQSGALCTAILDYAKGQNLGFSKFVSLGNKSDLNEVHLLQYLKDDPETDVILMYLEDLQDGWSFIQVARELTGDAKKRKPIITIKSGRTAQGAKAAQSHTGSLMGSDEVYDAIFAQAGVLRAESVADMFNMAKAFAYEPIPKNNRVAIVTNAGGPGIMTTDACVRSGLRIAELSAKTKEELKKVLPAASNITNPVDVIGDARHERYRDALQIISKDSNVDALIVILTPQAMTDIEDIAHVVVAVDRETDKPVFACFMGISDVSQGVHILEENEVPHYLFPEDVARALSAMDRYRLWTERPRTQVKTFPVLKKETTQIIQRAQDRASRYLASYEAMDVLKNYGFPVPPYGFATHEKEAAKIAKHVGYPVVMKIVSDQIVHKSDVGGVCLNLKSEREVKAAFSTMMRKVKTHEPKAVLEGVMIHHMAEKGIEVILGMKRDARFGPILMFGLGGIYVEAYKDVTFRVAPIRSLGARRMIEAIRAYPILMGFRSDKKSDLASIVDCLERLSQLACEQEELAEIDINPLLVYPEGKGVKVVDVRMLLQPKPSGGRQ